MSTYMKIARTENNCNKAFKHLQKAVFLKWTLFY